MLVCRFYKRYGRRGAFDDISFYSAEMPEILPFGKVNLIGADSLLVPHNMSGSELLDAVGGNSTLSEGSRTGQCAYPPFPTEYFRANIKSIRHMMTILSSSVLINADFNNENNYYQRNQHGE